MAEKEKLRILMIEDEEPERRRFREYGETQPDVEALWCVESVTEGLTVLREYKPRFVVLDLWLEGENGNVFLEEVRAMKHLPLYVFVVSNVASPFTKASLARTGLVEWYFNKSAESAGPAYLLQEMRKFTRGTGALPGGAPRRLSELPGRRASESSAELSPGNAPRLTPQALRRESTILLEKDVCRPAAGATNAICAADSGQKPGAPLRLSELPGQRVSESSAELSPGNAPRLTQQALRREITNILLKFGITLGSACFVAARESLYRAVELLREGRGESTILLEKDVYRPAADTINAICAADPAQKPGAPRPKKTWLAVRSGLRRAIQQVYSPGVDRALIRRYFSNEGNAKTGDSREKAFLFSFAWLFLNPPEHPPSDGE